MERGALISVLTGLFIASAVSGVKRGIRLLSNTNMVLTGLLALFVLIAGPTVFILNVLPTSLFEFFNQLGALLSLNANDGDDAVAFLGSWTTYYWAWWMSWTPFVGMFIAKISRGRTLREFVTTVMLVPSAIVVAWFVIYGSTAIWLTLKGADLQRGGTSEEVLFQMLQRLPHGMLTSIIAIALLLAGGRSTLSGLQSLMVVSALPFAIIVIGIMFSGAKDLRTDPYIIHLKYARAAIAQGVRRGIDEYGDDFIFGTNEVPAAQGAGAGFDSADPALTDWCVDASTGPINTVTPEDARRTLEPGRIQPRDDAPPERAASGEASLTVGEKPKHADASDTIGGSTEPEQNREQQDPEK